MRINRVTSLIENVNYIASPNYSEFPNVDAIDLLVIHSISLPPGQFGGLGIEKLFTNQLNADEHPYYKNIADLKVSAHALIRRDGKIIQFVPFNKRAWHAGKSVFMQRENCGDFSIGIELEGTDDTDFTERQYLQLASLTQELFNIYPKIARERIVGHSDIAPGRKTDPGKNFIWEKYFALLDFQSQ